MLQDDPFQAPPGEEPAGAFESRLRSRIAAGAGWLAAALGLAVLGGWAFDVDELKTVAPDLMAMRPWAAVGFVVAGFGLVFASAGKIWPAWLAGLAVLLIGGSALAQHLLHVDFGVDRLLFPVAVDDPALSHPGRLAAASAIGFTLLGLALLLDGRAARWGGAVASLGLLIVAVPLVGYVYGERALYGNGSYFAIPVHAAAGLVLLFIGTIAVRPPPWVLRMLGAGSGGRAARRLLPALVGVPLVAGALALEGARAGFYSNKLAVALVVMVTAVLLTAIMARYTARWDAADRAGRASNERLRLAVEGARLGTWEMDLRNGGVAWSARLREMHGLTVEERIATFDDWMARTHPDDREPVTAAFRQALDGRADHVDTEYRYECPDGQWRWAASYGRVVRDAAGVPQRALGIEQDVTPRKRAEETQVLLLREVDHRVKNSLQLVTALLTLQGRQVTDQATKRQLRDAATRVRAISRLHERLYQGTEVTRVDFGEYLRALCDDMRASAPEQVIRVEAESVTLPVGKAVPLGLIVTELITNAIKHAHPPDDHWLIEVTFGLTEGGDAELTVRDWGVGLPADFRPERSGTNLGMRVVRGFALQLGAELQAENAGPGARWTLRLPIA